MNSNHLYSENWKYSEDAICEYFGEILALSNQHLYTACRLLSAKKRNWRISDLLNAEKAETTLPIESSHWWTEWEGLLLHLENKFSIQFPRKGEQDAVYQNNNGHYSRAEFEGVKFAIKSEELSELVSVLCAGEYPDQKFFQYTAESVTEEEFLQAHPYSDSSKELTYNTLRDMPINSGILLGYYSLKSDSGKFGQITVTDLLANRWNVREKNSDQIQNTYSTLRKLVDAGWVLD